MAGLCTEKVSGDYGLKIRTPNKDNLMSQVNGVVAKTVID